MMIYTFSKARQNFSSLLDRAKREGEVLIKRKDGALFAIKPISQKNSPLNVEGIDIKLSANEIVDILREVRER
jgi:antitoxin (DNA-binding transcriptional repressor) of toxin-antitoxin stability system